MSDEGGKVGDGPSEPGEGTPPRGGLRSLLRGFSPLWGLALIVVVLLVWFRGIVLPFLFAMLVAYLFEPVVRWLAPRMGDRRGLAVLFIYLGLLGLLLGFFGGVLPGVVSDLSKLRDSTPEAVAKLNEEWLPKISEWFEETFPGVLSPERPDTEQVSEIIIEPRDDGSYRVDLHDAHLEVHESGGGWVIEAEPPQQDNVAEIIREIVVAKGDELTEVATTAIRTLVTGIASFLTDLVITFLLAAFILVDLERVQSFARSLVPAEHRRDFLGLVRGIDEGMAGVIRGQLLICLVNGALAYLGLLVFGVHYALLLAMVAAVLSIIPVFGILIAAIPLLGVALLSGDLGFQELAFAKSAGMLGWIVAIHLLEANYLNPRVIGTADIHPVIVIFALLAGWEVYGPLGAVLALPVASVIQTVFLHVRRRSAQREREASRSGVFDGLDESAIPLPSKPPPSDE